MSFLEWMGSDKSNGKMTIFGIGYIPITQKWNSGPWVESNLATKSTPFYLKPYLSMRELPVLRYQGDFTVLSETEQFVNV